MQLPYLLLIILNILNVVISKSCNIEVDKLHYFLSDNNVTSYKMLSVANISDVNSCSCEDNCLRKCCAYGYSFSLTERLCVQDVDNQNQIASYETIGLEAFYFVPGLSCKPYYLHIYNSSIKSNDTFEILKNGSLSIPMDTINPEEFCFENFKNKGIGAFVCFGSGNTKRVSIVIGMIISMPFLLITFIVYALLPDRNIPAKAVMCYVLSLLFAYILLVTIQLYTNFERQSCRAIALLCYFFFMASFFWMNVSCIDIWLTFSGRRGLTGNKRHESKRFLYYCGYAWGVPILFLAVVAGLMDSSLIEGDSLAPGIGNGQCWFSSGMPTFLYFYFPISVILVVNIVLFIITAVKIRAVKKDTAEMLKRNDSHKHKYEKDKQTFNLYVKLLLAMGINWTMEVISWAVAWTYEALPSEIWYLTDFCNALYGVFIFFIFVFKKNIWMLLKKRYLSFMGKPQLAHSMGTSTNRTIVSQGTSEA